MRSSTLYAFLHETSDNKTLFANFSRLIARPSNPDTALKKRYLGVGYYVAPINIIFDFNQSPSLLPSFWIGWGFYCRVTQKLPWCEPFSDPQLANKAGSFHLPRKSICASNCSLQLQKQHKQMSTPHNYQVRPAHRTYADPRYQTDRV